MKIYNKENALTLLNCLEANIKGMFRGDSYEKGLLKTIREIKKIVKND